MNWKLIVILIVIISFVLFGGINLTKSGITATKSELSKLKVDFSTFITKNQIPASTPPAQQSSMALTTPKSNVAFSKITCNSDGTMCGSSGGTL